MAITLRHIAEKAGVDTSVVSRVLNNKGKQARISEVRRAKIKEIARQLGYVPNASAQIIQSGRFGCAALLQSGLPYRSYTPSGLLDGIYQELEEKDMHLLIARIPENGQHENGELPKIFRTLMADGLIVNYNHHLPENILSAVSSSSMPAVWLNNKRSTRAVYADCIKGGYQAASKLLALGHTKIAYCDIYFDDLQKDAHYSVKDRLTGYEQAMIRAGLSPRNMSPSVNIQASMDDQVQYFKSMLTGPGRPTAIVLYWANAVPGLLTAARQLGLHVPEDISVITFASESAVDQGLSISAFLEPENEMGRTSVQMLNELIENEPADLPSRIIDFKYLDLGSAARCSEKEIM